MIIKNNCNVINDFLIDKCFEYHINNTKIIPLKENNTNEKNIKIIEANIDYMLDALLDNVINF